MAIIVFSPLWLRMLEYGLFDRLSQVAPPPPAGGEIVTVAIDDASLARDGRWPWPRTRTAQLIRAINANGPRVIAFAGMFPEPADGDPELAASFAAGPVLTGFAAEFAGSPGNRLGCGPPPAGALDFLGGAASARFHRATGAICNAPAIAAAAAASGFLNMSPDSDGILRRVPLFIRLGESLSPSLALSAVLTANPPRLAALDDGEGRPVRFRLNDHLFRLDEKGSLLPRFRPEGSYPRLSAADVLAGRVERARLNGKIVFLGVTARGAGDSRLTAASSFQSGLEIQANIADTLLHGGALAPLDAMRHWEAALAVSAGVATALLFFRLSAAPASFLTLLGGVGIVLLSWTVFVRSGSFLSPFAPLLAAGGNAAAGAVSALAVRRERDRRLQAELKSAHAFMLTALASLTTLRDVETGTHLARVQFALRLLCESLRTIPRFRAQLSPETVELLVSVSPIHDIGKIGIPDGILQKVGRLTPVEMDLIRKHVGYGRNVLEHAREQSGLHNPALFDMCCALVYSHHERWNGSGYPHGLKGEAIPLPARMLAIVDVYDALATRRVYKPALPHDEVVHEIAAGRGVLFDPEIVDAFLAQHERFREVYAEERLRAGTAASA